MGDVEDLATYRARRQALEGYVRPTQPEELVVWLEPPMQSGRMPRVGLCAPPEGARGWALTPAQAEALGLELVQAAAIMRLDREREEDEP